MNQNPIQTRTIGQKLKSTKLWACLAGVVVGVAIYMGADANAIQAVAGAVTATVSVVTYIITEGKIDAAAVAQAIQSIGDAFIVVAADEEDEDDEEQAVE